MPPSYNIAFQKKKKIKCKTPVNPQYENLSAIAQEELYI